MKVLYLLLSVFVLEFLVCDVLQANEDNTEQSNRIIGMTPEVKRDSLYYKNMNVEIVYTMFLHKIYPNPAKTTTNIEFFLHPRFRKDVSFEIYDYMGRKIKELDDSYEYNAAEAWGTKTVNVESIDSGIYYLVIDNGNEKRSIGFAVE